MSKIVSIPISYGTTNSDVGTWTFVSSPRNYEINNVKLEDLASALNSLSSRPHVLSEEWESVNINQWAAFKPTKNSSFPSGMKIVSSAIVWDKPAATPADYRLGDFGGYNHNATTPNISPTSDGFTYSSAGTYTRSVTATMPEFDVTSDIEDGTAITSFFTVSYLDSGRGFVEDVTTENIIETTDLAANSKSIDYVLRLDGLGSPAFKVEIYLGYDEGRGPVFVCQWPVFQVTGTATYNPFG